MERIPMTPEGYEQIRKRLEHLKNVELPRVERSLGAAREMGDLAENAEFDVAREELWRLERQIAELEHRISCAEVIDSSRRASPEAVTLGALVRVEETGSGRQEEFLLVGEGEVRRDVETVSVASPLGRALIGRREGETVEVAAPRGRLRYRVLGFRYG